jgi:hypothetical protein
MLYIKCTCLANTLEEVVCPTKSDQLLEADCIELGFSMGKRALKQPTNHCKGCGMP